jgi:ABC-type Fe3+/spermidine/putrescine transport system ATPase subunit
MLELRDIRRSFEHLTVLRDIDLTVNQGEILCLLGPSGCGKTTLLRIIAGLEKADRGDVLIDGRSILGLPVHQRNFGLMFQEFALFPHLNVAENIAFGLRMQGQGDIQQRQRDVLGLVGLSGFEKRDVTQLSGGEKQRVALARSLAPSPRLLMLDEPLGSLDAALREHLAVELRAIIKQVGLTALYVTHDQQEAFAIGDRVAVMQAGHIEQIDIPERVYMRPRTDFVAHFLGLNNIVAVDQYQDNYATTALGTFYVRSRGDYLLFHPLGLRAVDGSSKKAAIHATITDCVFRGEFYKLKLLHASGVVLTVNVPLNSDCKPVTGQQIALAILDDMIIPLEQS